ncbi:hypothetical protein ACR9YC_11860 [Parasphingorhabdus sp. DH2-15]|jgi:DNA-binding transcriptional MerR regulator|uniref:hypothetical protein n=1 Tax=Parasphingorhabdus sp. DH2-15 TaxID=3444112 RepID=UPI003F683587
MKYTPAQFRDAVGISQETFRHWRKVIPVFADRNGYRPSFTTSDLILGAVIKTLRTELGIPTAQITDLSVTLSQSWNGKPWALLLQSSLLINVEERSCSLHPSSDFFQSEVLQIVVPLAPILSRLSVALISDVETDQHQIPFPPSAVSTIAQRQAKKI